MHCSTCYVGEFHEILMSLYHCEGKLTKDPCKLLCLVQPTQHSDAPLCLASGRTERYADVCTLAPEQFCLQESKVKPELPTHFHLQDETPGGIFPSRNSHKDICWPGWQTFCVTNIQVPPTCYSVFSSVQWAIGGNPPISEMTSAGKIKCQFQLMS